MPGFIFHANWIYDEVSFKEGTECFSTHWHGWNIKKPLTWCKAQKHCYAPFLTSDLTGHPKMWGKVAHIGAGSGPADQHSLWQMIWQHYGGGRAVFYLKTDFSGGRKEGITKFAFNDMHFKTKTITAALIFLPFLLLGAQSALACCLGFLLNSFLTQIRALWQAAPPLPCAQPASSVVFHQHKAGPAGVSGPALQSVPSQGVPMISPTGPSWYVCENLIWSHKQSHPGVTHVRCLCGSFLHWECWVIRLSLTSEGGLRPSGSKASSSTRYFVNLCVSVSRNRCFLSREDT